MINDRIWRPGSERQVAAFAPLAATDSVAIAAHVEGASTPGSQ